MGSKNGKSNSSKSTRLSLEEYKILIDAARQQITDGEYLSVEELEKDSEKWDEEINKNSTEDI